MGASKPATTTTTQQRSPWAPAVGNLTYGLEQARGLADDAWRWTPTFSGSTNKGIAGLEAAAKDGSVAYDTFGQIIPQSTAALTGGLDQLKATAAGTYLNANPYLDAALQAGANSIANNVNGAFAGAGRYGSAAHTGALTKGIGELETAARMQNYATERGAQDNAARALMAGGYQGAALAPAMDQAQINPALLQLQAGNLRDQMAAAQRQAPMNAVQWLNSQTVPVANLGGDSTGTQTTTQPSNKMGQIIGGVQMGLGLLTGNPMMMLSGGSSMLGGGGGGMPAGYGSLGAF